MNVVYAKQQRNKMKNVSQTKIRMYIWLYAYNKQTISEHLLNRINGWRQNAEVYGAIR